MTTFTVVCSFKPLSLITERVFAFYLVVGFEPTAFCLNDRCSTVELYITSRDVRVQWVRNFLGYEMPHTTYLSSAEYLAVLQD